MNTLHDDFARRGLLRTEDGRLVGGVCAGLARRFGTDPWAVRALFIATLVVVPGSQLIIYPVLWVLMPEDGAAVAAAGAQHPTA